MKAHTSEFKNQIKTMGREIDSKITYTLNGANIELGKEQINSITPTYQGALLKSVMKEIDIDSNVYIPEKTILNYQFGVKVNGEYEYINFGNYIVYKVEKQEDTSSYKITCYDKMLYSMTSYKKMDITYPISIRDYINAICNKLGLTFKNANSVFTNYNKIIKNELYLDADGKSLDYTFRDVLDELSQATASCICVDENDEVEIRYINDTNDTIDEEFLKDINVNFGKKFGKLNTIVLSRSDDSDKISQSIPSDLPNENKISFTIKDNQIMNDNDRADFIPEILEKLYGLEFYFNDFQSTGICYYDLLDRYNVKIGDNVYSCIMLNDEIDITQGLEEKIYTDEIKEIEKEYNHISEDDRKTNQASIIAKKNESKIEAIVKNIGENGEITGASLILAINNDKSEAKLNADVIELTANDILNLLANNSINLTSKSITINSEKFNVDENGNVVANSFTSNNASITGGDFKITSTENNPKFQIVSQYEDIYSILSGASIRMFNGGKVLIDINALLGTGIIALRSNINEKATLISSDKVTTPKIEAGNIDAGICTLNSNNVVSVDFNKEFENIPNVSITPYTSASGVIAPKIRSISTTGFTAIIGGSGFSNIDCSWIAIG